MIASSSRAPLKTIANIVKPPFPKTISRTLNAMIAISTAGGKKMEIVQE